jgi:hypothetical protein
MTDINADKHGGVRNFWAELHTPQISAKLGVHLTNNVKENTVIVLLNGAVSDELRNDWRITINFVFQKRVEVLVVRLVRHNHKEDELRVLDLSIAALDNRQDFLVVVVLDRLSKTLKEYLLVVSCLVRNRANVSELYLNF